MAERSACPTLLGSAAEKSYPKYAWIINFVVGLLLVISSPIGLSGIPPNPPSPEGTTGLTLDQIAARIPGMMAYISSIARQLGNFMLAMGVMIMGIAAVPHRRGEKWAWYVSWILPVVIIIQLINSNGGYLLQLDFAFMFIVLAGLFLPYRKFFPKKKKL